MFRKLVCVFFSGFIRLCCLPDAGGQNGSDFAVNTAGLSGSSTENFFGIPLESMLTQDHEEICSIQKKLQKGEIILEYVITDKFLVILSVSRYKSESFRQPVDTSFRETLKAYKRLLKVADIADMINAGKKMYTMLILPVKKILDGKTRLIIIPGSDLSGIPFESFIVDKKVPATNGFSSQHYLIHDFEVTYHYSAKQWAGCLPVGKAYPTDIQDRDEIDFTGFCPGFYRSNRVNPLPGTRDELITIASMFCRKGLSAKMAVGEQSKKTLFMKLACNSRVIHLATHNDPDMSQPGSGGVLFWEYDPSYRQDTFSNGILTPKEICRLRLKADLVVLNACASGFGKKAVGYGLYSLPLGFLYAGAKNILATLWNITDRHAGKFMVNFYRRWLSGRTYSQALREAKMDMISCRETSLPTIWAAYVLIGR